MSACPVLQIHGSPVSLDQTRDIFVPTLVSKSTRELGSRETNSQKKIPQNVFLNTPEHEKNENKLGLLNRHREENCFIIETGFELHFLRH